MYVKQSHSSPQANVWISARSVKAQSRLVFRERYPLLWLSRSFRHSNAYSMSWSFQKANFGNVLQLGRVIYTEKHENSIHLSFSQESSINLYFCVSYFLNEYALFSCSIFWVQLSQNSPCDHLAYPQTPQVSSWKPGGRPTFSWPPLAFPLEVNEADIPIKSLGLKRPAGSTPVCTGLPLKPPL